MTLGSDRVGAAWHRLEAAAATAPWRGLLVGAPWLLAAVLAFDAVAYHVNHMPAAHGRGWIDTYVYQEAADGFLSAPSHLYDAAHLEVARETAQRAYIYPPSGLIPFLALVPLERTAGIQVSSELWACLDLAALLGAVVLLGRHLGLGWARLGCLSAILLVSGPVLTEVDSGQVNGAVLLLLVLAWIRLPRADGGVWLGMALALKPVGLLLLLAPLVMRRPRVTVVAVATLAAINLPLCALAGWDATAYYAGTVAPHLLGHVTWDTANLSLGAVLQTWIGGRPLSADGSGDLSPIDASGLATALMLALRLALVAGWLLALRRGRIAPITAFALAVATIPVLTGTAWLHYYVYLLPLIVVLLAAPSAAVRLVTWLATFPLLWNGLPVLWIYDPSRQTSLGLRILFAKWQLTPVLTAAVVGVVLVRALRSPRRDRPGGGGPAPPRGLNKAAASS